MMSEAGAVVGAVVGAAGVVAIGNRSEEVGGEELSDSCNAHGLIVSAPPQLLPRQP